MRYIYVDEAGKSEPEPHTVVVGVIVDADKQYLRTEAVMQDVLKLVPEHYRRGFISHAKNIWSDPKYRDRWELPERANFLKSLACIPRAVGLPLAYAVVSRDCDVGPVRSMSRADFQLVVATGFCLSQADALIEKTGGPEEVATVVVEDSELSHRWVRNFVNAFRLGPITIPDVRMTLDGAAPKETELTFRIKRIRDTPHFTAKVDSPFLWIADVCAWAIRGHLRGQEIGSEIVKLIGGESGLTPGQFARQFGGGLIVPSATGLSHETLQK